MSAPACTLVSGTKTRELRGGGRKANWEGGLESDMSTQREREGGARERTHTHIHTRTYIHTHIHTHTQTHADTHSLSVPTHVDNVSNEINDGGELVEAVDEDGKDVADAGENLHAVVEADDAVVARVCDNLALNLDVDARGGEGAGLAEGGLEAQAQPRAAFLHWHGVHAAGADVPLATLVIFHFLVQRQVPVVHDAAAWAQHSHAAALNLGEWVGEEDMCV